jgi:galactose oxidase
MAALAATCGLVALPAERASADPAQTGQWGAAFTPPNAVTAVHLALLHTGKLLMWGEEGQTVVWNPVTNTTVRMANPGPIFCGGHTILADGRVFVPGGRTIGIKGPNSTELFNPVSQTWTHGPDMDDGRYYPTATQLPDNTVLILGGTNEDGLKNDDVEVYTPGAPGTAGTMAHVADYYYNYYPHAFVLPNGKVGVVDRFRAFVEQLAPSWTRTAYASPVARGGQKSGVLLPDGPAGSYHVMIAGGLKTQTQALASTEELDFANPAAQWQARAPLPQPRHNMNMVLLPDGTVLTIGGNGSGKDQLPQRQALLYNPATNSWNAMVSQVERRAYHSTAVLLPDGRVVSGGDNRTGGGQRKLEIYSPPYLFKGARPTITSASSQVANGDTLTVVTPSAVARAVLMAPGAATHANDMHQRHVELAFTATATGITATAPGTGVAPPGYYMLFVLNGAGVPSKAAWVHVG